MADDLDFYGDDFMYQMDAMQKYCRYLAESKGWETDKVEDGTLIALIHSELSEALESLRHGNGPSEHIPSFTGAEEELADVVIRILDMAESRGWQIGNAIVAKLEFNKTRPHRHGGKKF